MKQGIKPKVSSLICYDEAVRKDLNLNSFCWSSLALNFKQWKWKKDRFMHFSIGEILILSYKDFCEHMTANRFREYTPLTRKFSIKFKIKTCELEMRKILRGKYKRTKNTLSNRLLNTVLEQLTLNFTRCNIVKTTNYFFQHLSAGKHSSGKHSALKSSARIYDFNFSTLS